MIALFSCAAHKNYQEIAAWCHEAENAVNRKLGGKNYNGIKYLSAQFSFLKLVGGVTPSLQHKHTLILTIEVEQFDTNTIINNFLKALDVPIVPKELRKDLQTMFTENGWLCNSMA